MSLLPADARIGSVTLRVRNIERSLAFYRDVLGFDQVTRAGRQVSLNAGGEDALVTLEEDSNAVPRPRRSAGLFHVAILVPSRAALGRSLRRLVDQDWPLTGVADHLVSEALYLNDPDGLGLEIYRDRPRDTWRHDGGEIVMSTDPLDLENLVREPGADQPWRGLGHSHWPRASSSA